MSQAHCICLILGGSAGRVSQSPPILVHCSASSFSKQPLTKCWNSWLPMSLYTEWARTGTVFNVSFMVLHNVSQSSTRGLCCLCIGGSITMAVWQIAVSSLQRITLLPSGEGRETSTEVLLVSSLLHGRAQLGLNLVTTMHLFY